jgi:hypothetical protein
MVGLWVKGPAWNNRRGNEKPPPDCAGGGLVYVQRPLRRADNGDLGDGDDDGKLMEHRESGFFCRGQK